VAGEHEGNEAVTLVFERESLVGTDATSLDRGASDSGVPQLQVQGIGYQPGLMSMLGQSMTVISNEFGSTEFRITDIEGTESGWTLTGGSPLSALVQAGTIPSMTGQPIESIIEMFFNAVGIKRAQYTLEIDKALLKEKYDVPAQRVVVWQAMKQWLSANEIDMSWEVGKLKFQPLRNRIMYVNDVTSGYNLTMSSSQKVKNIDVNVYHRMAFRHDVIWPPRPLLYPDAKTTFGQTDTPVITVNAGEQTVTTLQLPCEVSSVRQPRQVMAIPVVNKAPLVDNQNTPNGIYMVVGKDNKAITPAQWQDMGGGLEVRLNKDKRSVDVIVTGMLFEELSPFRICESDGKTDYNGLFLLGENGTYVVTSPPSLEARSHHGNLSRAAPAPARRHLTRPADVHGSSGQASAWALRRSPLLRCAPVGSGALAQPGPLRRRLPGSHLGALSQS